jgi:transposase
LKHGLDYFITINTGGHPKSTISTEVNQALYEKVHNSTNPFLSYVEAVQWVKENFNQDVKYTTLRRHMVKHFRPKPKTPRKSHYKKDEEAFEAFKKKSLN